MVGHSLQASLQPGLFLPVLLDLGRSFKTVLINFPFLCHQVVFTVSVSNGEKCYARVNHYL